MNGHENMAAFFSGLGALVTALREAQSAMDRTAAPAFSPIRYFGSGAPTVRNTVLADVNAPELYLSRVFGDFLDSRGTHGQGARPLRLLLNAVRAAYPAFPEVCAKDCRVRLEEQTYDDRSIDIALAFPGGVHVGVENKPWAADQGRQIADYLAYLERRAGDPSRAWMLYFSGTGREPAEHALPPEPERRERCITVPYRTLRNGALSIDRWLDRCREKCEANPVRDFLACLREYIRARLPKPTRPSSREEQAMWNFIRGDRGRYVALAIQVQDLGPREDMYREILERIATRYMDNAAWHVRVPDEDRIRNNNSCLVLQRADWGLAQDDCTTGLCLGTENEPDWGKVYVGFRVRDKDRERCQEFYRRLDDVREENPNHRIHEYRLQHEVGWPIWKYVDPDYRNWDVAFIRRWLADTKSIARYLRRELKSVRRIIGPNGDAPFRFD